MSEVTFPIGPQHPALKEPERFTITSEGERVVDAEIRLGYCHRSIEAAAQARNYARNIYLCERICGICSYIHSNTYVRAVESLLEIELPPRAQYIRTVVAELERLHSHILWLGVAAHEVGYDTLFMYAWRDREIVQDLLELITGNRVNHGMVTIGGVRSDLTEEMMQQTLEGTEKIRQRLEYYADVCTTESTFLKRVEDVGILSAEDARQLGAVGPTARASNVGLDIRADFPYDAYTEIDFEPITSDLCDNLGRTIVRIEEVLQSCGIIEQLLADLPEGDIQVKAKSSVPEGESVSRTEAPRGELLYYIASDGSDQPARVKVRTPSLANWPSVLVMLEDTYVADVPITIASIDPCMACTDR